MQEKKYVPGTFTKLFHHYNDEYRAEIGKEPRAQASPPQAARPVAAVVAPPPPDPDPLPPTDLNDWRQTMLAMEALQEVYLWGEAQRPGTLRQFMELEGQCLVAAQDGRGPEYQRLKKGYLKFVGELCEIYYKGHFEAPTIEASVWGLPGKKIRLHAHPAPPQPEDGVIDFFVREIPLLCCATPGELQRICAVKEAMPGSLVI